MSRTRQGPAGVGLRRRGSLFLGVLLFMAALGPAVAAADDPSPVPNPPVVMAASRFWPGDACLAREGAICLRSSAPLTIREGSSLTASNLDLPRHDLRSTEVDPETGRLLFSTKILVPGASAPVTGVERLEPGVYSYYCTLHPPAADGTGMRGLLRVLAGGAQ